VTLLSVENLKTYYSTSSGFVKAVDGVSFNLEKGESLGLAGESGCGKSTLGFSLMRLIKGGEVVGGDIKLNGMPLLEMSDREFNRIRWESISLISQAAMGALNPVYRIGTQIVEAIKVHRKTKKSEAWERAEDLLRQVEIDPSRAFNYPHELSGGMRQRAMIAMALALDPDLIIADEPTTALDVVTQVQVLKLLRALQRKLDVSIILISHDLSILGQACDRVIIMYAGKIAEIGNVEVLFKNPLHPYTQALLDSFPDIKGDKKPLTGLPGSPPDLLDPPSGCRLHPRCPEARNICQETEPQIIDVSSNHSVACHMVDQGG
jgi:peptide/nickel transport system ATP-binding protein